MQILIVKMSSLGDVVQATPVVADLLKHFPDAQIDWVVEEAFAGLLRRVHGLRRIVPIALRRWRRQGFDAAARAEQRAFHALLRAEAYDAVLDVQGLIKSAWVARRARLNPGGFRATYGNGSDECGWEWPVRFMVDRPVPMDRRIHAVQRYRQLAARALGYGETPLPTYAFRTEALPQGRTLVLVHGTTRPDNEWPAAHWIALASRLAEAGWRVALPQADDAERQRAEHIVRQIGLRHPGAATVWPRAALTEVLDRMAGCAGVIGIDTGLSHLAVALRLPHVQIFSHPRAFRAGPLPCPFQISVGGAAAPGVDAVWQAWQQVAAAAPALAPAPASA